MFPVLVMVRIFPVCLFQTPVEMAQLLGVRSRVDLTNKDASAQNMSAGFVCRTFHKDHSMGIFYGENPFHHSFTLFLFEMVFVISLSRLLRFLLKPLKQPKFTSEILAGFIVGPSLLGRNKTFSDHMFPENSQFVITNIGTLGFTYFLFLLGVKMDPWSLVKVGRKHAYMAAVGISVPFVAGLVVGFITQSSMDKNVRTPSGFGAVAANFSLTACPVVYLILKELNLLSSEVGRLALTSSLISEMVGILLMTTFQATQQDAMSGKDVVWYVMSLIVISFFLLVVVRRLLFWIIKNTPEGKPVNQNCIILLMLGVPVIAFLADMFGVGMANAAFWLGLIVPDGPPLGATLVERIETIVTEIWMPLAFASVGMNTNVPLMIDYGWSFLAPLIALALTCCVTKFLATTAVALYFKIPLKDSIALGLVMNVRGQVEIAVCLDLASKQVLNISTFTLMTILTTIMAFVFPPLISILYDPTRPYMVNKRRTIQHTPPGTDFRVVVCVQQDKDVPSLVNFLEISYPSLSNPFAVYAIHLVELVGRAAPLFIDHEQPEGQLSKYADFQTIYHALQLYQESRSEFVKLQLFTTMTAKRTMYQDVCKLALINKAVLIIFPFNHDAFGSIPGTEIVRQGLSAQTIYSNVLKHAPCSVALLVDKSQDSNPVMAQSFRQSQRKFVMLFLGGADAREALTYADRMAMNPEVLLMVVRFLSYNGEGDNEIEKKLDDGVVTWFWVKNERNERVAYREVLVRNGEETLAAIHALNDGSNELWIVGREQGINPIVVEGLSSWSQNPELGIVGDVLASADFGSSASVLVVQQQIMRAQGKLHVDAPKRKFASAIRYQGV